MDTLTARFNCCFDPGAPVVYFPIRHHSPACSLHLGRLLEDVPFDCILIEGPADTNHLLPHIAAADSQAPLCIYYSCVHKETDEVGETGEHRTACYYPLLDFSPELGAIRHGAGAGVATRFIDLPYGALSRLERERRRDKGKSEKNTYYDDYYLSRSDYIQRLCKKTGCRHYGELWEKYFEIGGLDMSTAEFVRALLAMCHFSRVEEPRELLEEEGCLAREAHMAACIAHAKGEFGKILVVTGGFHTAALAELVEGMEPGAPPPAPPRVKANSYLIPYSLAESDQLAGYASGMPYPAFYQQVYGRMQKDPDTAFDAAVLHFLARIGGELRRKKESTSLADEIAALAQSKGLAELRDKPRQGVYELLDAVRSAYVKDGGAAGNNILRTARQLLRGDAMGSVTAAADKIPLLVDFQAQAARFRLKVRGAARQEITLDILTKPLHREASVFLHRLDFLEADFGRCLSGPDYRRRDTARVRERWRYASSARVQSRLVDVSYLGGTVREAASTLLSRKREPDAGCGACTRLLIDAAVMDLTEHMDSLTDSTREAVAQDGSFLSLAQAAANLLFLEDARWLLNLPEGAIPRDLLFSVYHKGVSLLPGLSTGHEEEDRELAKILKDLYQVSRREGMAGELLDEALRELADRDRPPPCVQGSAAGLLYASGALGAEQVLEYARSYLYGSGGEVQLSGRFLSGLFLSAWDILFAGTGFLEGLSHLLESLEESAFLNLLPDLRLAFSVFTPSQIQRVGGEVAALLGVTQGELAAKAVPEGVLALGRTLDEHAGKTVLGEGAAL